MLSALEPRAHSLLRIIAGFTFSLHGFQKLFGWGKNVDWVLMGKE
jgi:hypothetical protein